METSTANLGDCRTPGIFALRTLHTLAALFLIGCLGLMYYSAVVRVHGPCLYGAMTILGAEGLVVTLNRGQCPLTGIQHRLGDEKGFFNLFMLDVVARRMVPFWFIAALIAYILVWGRW